MAETLDISQRCAIEHTFMHEMRSIVCEFLPGDTCKTYITTCVSLFLLLSYVDTKKNSDGMDSPFRFDSRKRRTSPEEAAFSLRSFLFYAKKSNIKEREKKKEKKILKKINKKCRECFFNETSLSLSFLLSLSFSSSFAFLFRLSARPNRASFLSSPFHFLSF